MQWNCNPMQCNVVSTATTAAQREGGATFTLCANRNIRNVQVVELKRVANSAISRRRRVEEGRGGGVLPQRAIKKNVLKAQTSLS